MDELLEQLEEMNKQQLQAVWIERFGEEEPSGRAVELLRRRIGWRLQEDLHGGLRTTTKRRLREAADAFERDERHVPQAKPNMQNGTVLTREWKGKKYTVQVKPDGYIYNSTHYKGLSKIAREITGTRWSGPLFFGLRKPAKKEKVAL